MSTKEQLEQNKGETQLAGSAKTILIIAEVYIAILLNGFILYYFIIENDLIRSIVMFLILNGLLYLLYDQISRQIKPYKSDGTKYLEFPVDIIC